MITRQSTVTAITALALSALSAGAAMAQAKPMGDAMAKVEKCYGVSMAGKND